MARLGKHKPKFDPKTLQFKKYIRRASLPSLYPNQRWGQRVSNWGMMKNDTVGDCTIATVGHMVMQWTSDAIGTPKVISDSDIIKAYTAVTARENNGHGYNPVTGANDNGCNILDVLNYWKNVGVGGDKCGAFVQLETGNIQHIQESIHLFGSSYIGVNLPLSAQDQINANQGWSVPSRGANRNGTPGSWGGHAICLAEETKISLLNGKEVSIKELAETHGNKNFWVYSCDEHGNIVPGLAHSPRKTGTQREVVKVTLDDGSTIRCTSDHKFLMRDGTYKEAGKLKPDDSLMPLYRKESNNKAMKGYEEYLNPLDNKWNFSHRMVANAKFGSYKGVIHHADFCKKNNDPGNLDLMTWEEHTKLHAQLAKPELLIQYAKSEIGREKSRELMNTLWSNSEWREKSKIRAKENFKKGSLKQLSENRLGFQTMDKDQLKSYGKKYGPENIKRAHTAESVMKSVNTSKEKFKNDETYRNKKIEIAKDNLSKIDNNTLTRKQRLRRRENALKLNYNRWHKNKYSSFEECLKKNNIALVNDNHKVVSVMPDGKSDVYDLTVDKYHNFATNGIFVHNCLVGYDKDGFTCVTWGGLQHLTYNFFRIYCDEAYAVLDQDWFSGNKPAPSGFDLSTLQEDLNLLATAPSTKHASWGEFLHWMGNLPQTILK